MKKVLKVYTNQLEYLKENYGFIQNINHKFNVGIRLGAGISKKYVLTLKEKGKMVQFIKHQLDQCWVDAIVYKFDQNLKPGEIKITSKFNDEHIHYEKIINISMEFCGSQYEYRNFVRKCLIDIIENAEKEEFKCIALDLFGLVKNNMDIKENMIIFLKVFDEFFFNNDLKKLNKIYIVEEKLENIDEICNIIKEYNQKGMDEIWERRNDENTDFEQYDDSINQYINELHQKFQNGEICANIPKANNKSNPNYLTLSDVESFKLCYYINFKKNEEIQIKDQKEKREIRKSIPILFQILKKYNINKKETGDSYWRDTYIEINGSNSTDVENARKEIDKHLEANFLRTDLGIPESLNEDNLIEELNSYCYQQKIYSKKELNSDRKITFIRHRDVFVEKLIKKIENLDYPSWFRNISKKNITQNFETKRLNKSDYKYINIENEFKRFGATLDFIDEIQNYWTFDKYKKEIKDLKKLKRRFDTNFEIEKKYERLLWHGTSKTNPCLLIDKTEPALNVNFADPLDKNKLFWGRALYFCENAEFCDKNYAFRENGSCYLLLCKVFVGEYKVEERNPSLRQPPMNNEKGIRYDSVKGENQPIFAVYDNYRSYPFYLVKYHHEIREKIEKKHFIIENEKKNGSKKKIQKKTGKGKKK